MDALGWDSAHLLGDPSAPRLPRSSRSGTRTGYAALSAAMAAGPRRPGRNLRYLNLGTVLRLARKRYRQHPRGRRPAAGRHLPGPARTRTPGRRAVGAQDWQRNRGTASTTPSATHRQLAAFRTAAGLRARLRSLQVPALAIHGEDDPWASARVPRTASRQDHPRRPVLITYPGTGHEFPQHLLAHHSQPCARHRPSKRHPPASSRQPELHRRSAAAARPDGDGYRADTGQHRRHHLVFAWHGAAGAPYRGHSPR